LRTNQAAAQLAMPGDVITVREGVYRERIDPPRGGESDQKRIIYQAAPGAKVAIKGSEVVKGWERVEDDIWRVTLSNRFFGGFNPYADEIRGDWFIPKDRKHHTGAVYLDGHWLVEAATPEEVLKSAGEQPLWFATVDQENTTITARFPGTDPNTASRSTSGRRFSIRLKPGATSSLCAGSHWNTPPPTGRRRPPNRSASSAPTGARAG
jgi:hypothetical protein